MTGQREQLDQEGSTTEASVNSSGSLILEYPFRDVWIEAREADLCSLEPTSYQVEMFLG